MNDSFLQVIKFFSDPSNRGSATYRIFEKCERTKSTASLFAKGVSRVAGLKFILECHLWLRPFITAENIIIIIKYYTATVGHYKCSSEKP